MKIGLGLYREHLTPDNFTLRHPGRRDPHRRAPDELLPRDGPEDLAAATRIDGWGDCSPDTLWSYEELPQLVANVREAGLELAAIENFSPKFWYDILLDGPERRQQIDGLKRLIRDAGRAGVPCIGYNFSIAGVYGWTRGPYARGDAHSVGFGMETSRSGTAAARWPGLEHALPSGHPGAAPISVSNDELWSGLPLSWRSSSLLPKKPALCLPPIPTIRRPKRCAAPRASSTGPRNTTG